MDNTSENTLETTLMTSDQISELTEDAEVQPLTPSRKVELWTGRFAMVGFMTTVAAIAAT
ncbi:MAG: hypothetical protein HC812_01240 [Leptolyngbya sp. RL_3_1]|nr:hypothetical protein [Leptolyngbya sp. RL_3_1]